MLFPPVSRSRLMVTENLQTQQVKSPEVELCTERRERLFYSFCPKPQTCSRLLNGNKGNKPAEQQSSWFKWWPSFLCFLSWFIIQMFGSV